MNGVKTERIVALDVLRGLTVALMILVNNPGDWEHIYAPLQHAAWNGCTPTDLVFPFFLFIMGVSGYISLAKIDKLSFAAFKKIFVRFIIMFLIGLGLNVCFSFFGGLLYYGESVSVIINDMLGGLRIWGVLQRLAIAYLFGSLLALAVPLRHLWKVILGLLLAQSLLLFFGNGYVESVDSIANTMDRWVFRVTHFLRPTSVDGNQIFIDPEGSAGILSSIAHYLLGILCGLILISKKPLESKIIKMSAYGISLLFAGFLLSYMVPINKHLWTSSYVLTTAGFASLTLVLLICVIDYNGRKRWVKPFLAFGMNPLFIYMFSQLLDAFVSFIRVGGGTSAPTIKDHAYAFINNISGNFELSSLIYAVIFVGVCYVVAKVLHDKKIIIKI